MSPSLIQRKFDDTQSSRPLAKNENGEKLGILEKHPNKTSEKKLLNSIINGVYLKPYESILSHIFSHGIIPKYLPLPKGDEKIHKIPIDLSPKKKQQVQSILRCIFAMLSNNDCSENDETIKIVDFGGGTGHLSIPLASLLPQCEIIVVDLKKRSLEILHQRAAQLFGSSSDNITYTTSSNQLQQSCHISNLYTFHGSIQSYPYPFHIGIALHACGEASDVTLHKCARNNASFLVSPCCIGKLQQFVSDPYIYQATNTNTHAITYPQSLKLKEIVTRLDFDILSKAAEGGGGEDNIDEDVRRSVIKSVLEWDRLSYMKQKYGYETVLTKMEPRGASPKDDILLGWLHDSMCPYGNEINKMAVKEDEYWPNTYVKCVVNHFMPIESISNTDKAKVVPVGDILSINCTKEEEEEIQSEICKFVADKDSTVLQFPVGQGARRRKLVHYVAESMGLKHWSEGKRRTERRIIVAKKKKKSEDV